MAITPGQITAGSGFLDAYASSEAQRAQSIGTQTSYLLQARDTLAVADVRADMSEQYATIQAGRTIKKAEIEAQNYQIAGNTLLKNMRSVNASVRARAAASGVVVGEGSNLGIQRENVAATMRDVGVSDLNALTARVMGFEDASAMLQSTEYQNYLNRFTAQRQAGQYTQAATAARNTGGLLANATIARSATELSKFITKG